MKTKHTKGEWDIHEGISYDFIKSNTKLIAMIDSLNPSAKEHKANAKLISAAPELLEALIAMDDLDKLNHLSDEWWKQAEICDELRNKAIKKATEKEYEQCPECKKNHRIDKKTTEQICLNCGAGWVIIL